MTNQAIGWHQLSLQAAPENPDPDADPLHAFAQRLMVHAQAQLLTCQRSFYKVESMAKSMQNTHVVFWFSPSVSSLQDGNGTFETTRACGLRHDCSFDI